MADWQVYMIRCADGSLYTGIARDPVRRLEQHRSGGARAAKYLRGRAPLRLVFARVVGARADALRVERAIKSLPKTHKEQIVRGRRACPSSSL